MRDSRTSCRTVSGAGLADHGKDTRRLSVQDARARPFIMIFIMLSLMIPAGCKDKVNPGTAQVQRPPVTGVTVAEVSPSRTTEYYETAGTVRAKTTSIVSSRAMGVITSVRVREGEKVSQGQVLMTIDDRDLLQKVRAAEKAAEAAHQHLTLAEATWERYKTLFEGRAISRQEFDQHTTQKNVAESEYERAKAGLSEARVYWDYARVTAPVSGIVTARMADQGSMAIPGMPLLSVEDVSEHTVDVRADGRLLPTIKAGMNVEILVDDAGQTLQGKITEIVPSIDPSSRTFLVKIAAAGGLRSGQYARVKIPVGTREAVFIPRSAVVQRGQLTGVYAVSDKGLLSYRLVKTGAVTGDTVEILSGLTAKEKVVVKGADRAVDGGEIRQ